MNLLTELPRNPQITTRKKTGNRMSSQMVNPTFRPELNHYGINEWVSCSCLDKLLLKLINIEDLYFFLFQYHFFPSSKMFRFTFPRYLFADGVSNDFIKVRNKSSASVVELSP